MKSGASWLVALLCACAAAGAGVWGYQEHRRAGESDFVQKRLDLLQADNVRLQSLVEQQKKDISNSYEVAQRKSIEEAVVAIRGLDFKEPVVYDSVTRADIKKVLGDKLSQQYSDRDFKNFSDSLAAFGLVEPNYPLKEKYIALLGEQIAAFYDQHQHKLFMFEDATLHDMQNRIVLAHELTHALQDQHFGLMLLPLEVKDNDDLALATSALIEGDATVVMADYESKNMSMQTLTDGISNMLSQNTSQLERAPRFLREMLFFPYSHGRDFCMALYNRGGYAALSAAYQHPPASSTQILHPEKYFAHEEPIRVQWPDLTVSGEKPIDDNVFGEFGIRILLSKYLGETAGASAAEGWRGDRYLVFNGGKGLVWKTLWADPEHAQHFRDALLAYTAKRFKQSTTDTTNPECALFSSPECNGEIISAKTDNGIIFIWGATKELNDALVEKFKE